MSPAKLLALKRIEIMIKEKHIQDFDDGEFITHIDLFIGDKNGGRWLQNEEAKAYIEMRAGCMICKENKNHNWNLCDCFCDTCPTGRANKKKKELENTTDK